MASVNYNPFGKASATELTATDLAVLIDVPEGWFIEYKREPDNPKDYAKEASAFANSRGGWIFVGLAEDSSTHKPSGGPGIPKANAQQLLDAARDAITQNLSPAPYIELKVVGGPIPELLVPDDRSILVIHIPESKNTPHIHSLGKIYKRQVDAACPVSITNRAELDELYERKKRLVELADEQLNVGFDEQWAKDIESPWIHVALTPDSIESNNIRPIRFESFGAIVKAGGDKPMLPDIYPSSFGYVARNHSHQTSPNGAAVSFEYAHNGAFYLSIPLSSGSLSAVTTFNEDEPGRRFARLLEEKKFGQARIFDGTYLIACLYALFRYVRLLLEQADISCKYYCRIRFRNFFRYVPFYASETYINWCEKNSIPVLHRNNFQLPWQSKNFFEIQNLHAENVVGQLVIEVMRTLGVNDEIMGQVAVDVLPKQIE